ncbi:MAG: DUF6444 domain-containing protein [Planctomycetia bacterium]|nr:DUF6444 domain-containing protein [Planctomycetia bacterium]
MNEKDQIIAGLQKQLVAKDKQLEEMRKLNEMLLLRIARLEKNSSNSSKPLSSDIVKQPMSATLPGVCVSLLMIPNTNKGASFSHVKFPVFGKIFSRIKIGESAQSRRVQ